MRLQFNPILIPHLPKLAWCVEIRRNAPIARVIHGPWVDAGEFSFVEGAWSGSFQDASFVDATTFTGSGAVITSKGFVFSASTHTLQPLCLIRLDNKVLVSNSLVFLLVRAGDEPDPYYRYYVADLMSIVFGLKKYIREIPTAHHHKIRLFYHCNLLIRPDLTLLECQKGTANPFMAFSDYYDFIRSEVSKIGENAQDSARIIQYSPLATISSGYDSLACAALAASVGCRQAITFTKPEVNTHELSDSGREIGEMLGLTTAEFDSTAYLMRDDLPELEFLATGLSGDDIIFSNVEKVLPQRLLFTGFHGDRVWAKFNDEVGSDIVRGDLSGASMLEFRLRLGFIHLPIPFIGCLRHEDIYRISNSPEMHHWSIPGTKYNRPIPRRIIEDAGIPRTFFGQTKKVVARPTHSASRFDPPLDFALSSASLREFQRWSANIALFSCWGDRVKHIIMYRLYRLNKKIVFSHTVRRLVGALRLKLPQEVVIAQKYAKRRTQHTLLFHWGFERVKERYLSVI